MGVYVCVWGFSAMLSQVFPVVQSPLIYAVGPALKPWPDSPCGTGTAIAAGGGKPNNGYKTCESVEKVFISLSSPGGLNRALTFLCIHEG